MKKIRKAVWVTLNACGWAIDKVAFALLDCGTLCYSTANRVWFNHAK